VLVARQQEILDNGDWVAEGRDICTVVAPDAQVRIWLTADERLRAERRAAETGGSVEEILGSQRERDAADGGHGRSTLDAPEGAVVLDTTDLSPEAVVERIVALTKAS
jgi:cytidylate kinase